MSQADFSLPSLITLADWLLLGGVLVVSLGVYGFRLASPVDAGQLLTIVRAGDERVAQIPLASDTTLVVEGAVGKITIVQRGGELWFEDAPCRLKICERMGHVQRGGEVIVCAPNRVMARIESTGGGDNGGLDAIAR